MWTAKIRERWTARAVSVDERVVLVGARGCSLVLDKDPQGGLECSKYTSPVTFSCANQTALMFSEPLMMPKVVDWAFEGLLGLIFIVTF